MKTTSTMVESKFRALVKDHQWRTTVTYTVENDQDEIIDGEMVKLQVGTALIRSELCGLVIEFDEGFSYVIGDEEVDIAEIISLDPRYSSLRFNFRVVDKNRRKVKIDPESLPDQFVTADYDELDMSKGYEA